MAYQSLPELSYGTDIMPSSFLHTLIKIFLFVSLFTLSVVHKQRVVHKQSVT